MRATVPCSLMLLFGLACAAAEKEGDDAGECSDGADNDSNGYFDCNDNACANSPDCDGSEADADTDADSDADSDADTDSDTDADTDADTDSDTDTDTDADLSAITAYDVEMVVNWTFPTGGFENCVLTYAGSGDLFDATDTRLSFAGPYDLVDTTCTDHASLEAFFPWYDRSTGQANSSFVFSDAVTIDEWFADASEYRAGVRADWYMYEMGATYYPDALYAEHSEVYEDPGGSFVVTYQVEMTFFE